MDKFDDLTRILKKATMVRIESTIRGNTLIRGRDKDGNYAEVDFNDIKIDRVKLNLYHRGTVTDMWAVGYGDNKPTNIGITIEEGTLNCATNITNGLLEIDCNLPR